MDGTIESDLNDSMCSFRKESKRTEHKKDELFEFRLECSHENEESARNDASFVEKILLFPERHCEKKI